MGAVCAESSCPGREAEDHDLEMIVVVKGAAEDAVLRNYLHLGFQVGIERVAS